MATARLERPISAALHQPHGGNVSLFCQCCALICIIQRQGHGPLALRAFGVPLVLPPSPADNGVAPDASSVPGGRVAHKLTGTPYLSAGSRYLGRTSYTLVDLR